MLKEQLAGDQIATGIQRRQSHHAVTCARGDQEMMRAVQEFGLRGKMGNMV